jgi:5-methylcytosine-specific restriction endonuclease McrA
MENGNWIANKLHQLKRKMIDYDGPIPMDVDVDIDPPIIRTSARRKTIPAPIRRKVWTHYIGETNAKGKCMCCNDIIITPFMFECGHVISVFNGGDVSISNLRPICSSCNKSMGSTNMTDYMITNKLPFPPNWNGY